MDAVEDLAPFDDALGGACLEIDERVAAGAVDYGFAFPKRLNGVKLSVVVEEGAFIGARDVFDRLRTRDGYLFSKSNWCRRRQLDEQLMDPELIDRIYECSLVPELWPGVLNELAKLAEARAGFLFISTSKAEVPCWIASPENYHSAERMANEGRFWRGRLAARLFAARHAGFLTELDLVTPDELDLEPVYRGFWRPQGVGWVVGTAISIPTGENATVFMTRWTERGPFEPAIVQTLDEMRPHLARSALLSARLQLERARAVSEALALIGLPALVLNEQGKVLG
jgi:hypothetical protein